MRVAVVHTVNSPCRCHEAIAGALTRGGHEPVVVGAEELLAQGASILGGARVGFDHTDTVAGDGRRRGEPRRLLERAGVSVIGGTAEACELADDKLLAREAMPSGVPIPRGGSLGSPDDPDTWSVGWPRVLKARREHMSRGVRVARDRGEMRAKARELIAAYGGPLVVEEYVEGRELAVTLIEGADGPSALPVAEWRVEQPILTYDDKLAVGVVPFVAELTDQERHATADAARRAFVRLGLRDYARVDLRLSPDGRAYVLEVNPRPSLEPDSPTAISAAAWGTSLDDLILHLLARAAARAGER